MKLLTAVNDNASRNQPMRPMTLLEGGPLLEAAFVTLGISPDLVDDQDVRWASFNDKVRDLELWQGFRDGSPDLTYVLRDQVVMATIDHGRDGQYRLTEKREYSTAEAALAAFLKPYLDAPAPGGGAVDQLKTL